MGGSGDKTDRPASSMEGLIVKELIVEELIDERKLARRLGISVALLAKWRRQGGGPAFIQITTTLVRYAASDVQKWIEERKLIKKGQTGVRRLNS